MPRFVAVPVGQGDAFFVETSHGSVLIDGGRSVWGLPDLFTDATGKDGVDVLVATHNDADHANGVLGFLARGLRCREVWLPGRWAQLLPYVLEPWDRLLSVLVDQVPAVPFESEGPDCSVIERYAESVAAEFEEEEESSDGRPCSSLSGQPVDTEFLEERTSELEGDESGWPGAVVPLLEDASFVEPSGLFLSPVWSWKREVHFALLHGVWPFLSPRRRQLLLEAIEAASRIREIALEAYHRGIRVRWFKWAPQSPGGGLSWLQPLNSRQITTVKPIPRSLFFKALSLTTSNRHSLVFWIPPPAAGGGVLFTADSDLDGVVVPRLYDSIVTAPHHGSEANKRVYSMVSAPAVWVRSDGRFRRRPCQEYKHAVGRRYCTLCRGSTREKQPVRFYERQGRWVRAGGTQPCVCT